MNDLVVHVNISEVKVAKNNHIMKMTLGSCLGIFFIKKDWSKVVGAHCLLPTMESKSEFCQMGARYVNQGFFSILSIIKNKNIEDYDIIITGGANMMNRKIKSFPVGAHNIDSINELLKEHNLVPKHCDVGGRLGRKVMINCKNKVVEIKKLNNE